MLSLSDPTQREARFALLRREAVAGRKFDKVGAHLKEPLGTGFEHYCFHKIEYILWKYRYTNQRFMDPECWRDFRITSKNSFEHVHPQHHKYRQEQLPGENSSYSNMNPEQKWVDFTCKHTYDSLKLAHIFHIMKPPWSKELMEIHRDKMIASLEAHYAAASQQLAAQPVSTGAMKM